MRALLVLWLWFACSEAAAHGQQKGASSLAVIGLDPSNSVQELEPRFAEQQAEVEIYDSSIEPEKSFELTNKAIKCGQGLVKLSGEESLRLVFLTFSKMLLETRTFLKGDVDHLADRFFWSWFLLPPKAAYQGMAKLLNKIKVKVREWETPDYDDEVYQKMPKTLFRILFSLVDVMFGGIEKLNSKFRSKVQEEFANSESDEPGDDVLEKMGLTDKKERQWENPQFAYIQSLGDVLAAYNLANRLTKADAKKLSQGSKEAQKKFVDERYEKFVNRIEMIQENFLDKAPKAFRALHEDRRVECKTLSMVLEAASTRLDENDKDTVLGVNVITSASKIINFMVTSAVTIGVSFSHAGPAAGALAGAAVGMVTSVGDKLFSKLLQHDQAIKAVRRSVRKSLISTLQGYVSSAQALDERTQKYQFLSDRIAVLKKNQPSASFSELKYQAKLDEFKRKPTECLPALQHIAKDILTMLYHKNDAQLLKLIDECTGESYAEVSELDSVKGLVNTVFRPSTYQRLLPTLQVIADNAGFKHDGVNAVEGADILELAKEVLGEDGKEFMEKLGEMVDEKLKPEKKNE